MKMINFANTKEKVSEFCLGTMMFGQRCDEKESERIVNASLDAGVNFIDTAARYADGICEEILGRILAGKRKNIFLATKTRLDTGLTIAENLNRSLKRLNTDYIDLFIIHWPMIGMDVVHIMNELNELVKSGKIKYLGCSNYPAWLLAHSNMIADQYGWAKIISNQIPYNIIERSVEIEILPQAVAEDIAITVYRSLSVGLLSGRYKPGETIPKETRVGDKAILGEWLEKYKNGMKFLFDLARDKKVTPVQVAISWVRYSKAVACPIVGISRLDQLDESLKAFEFDLTKGEYEKINEVFDSEVKEESSGEFQGYRKILSLTKK
jgi:1-deoxyxylulose-5-phosphate synthase